VRPIGANDEYPPTVLTGNPGGFSINVNLEDGSKIEFQVSTDTIVAGAAGFVYTRWTGGLNATTDCGEVLLGGQALLRHSNWRHKTSGLDPSLILTQAFIVRMFRSIYQAAATLHHCLIDHR
jgi:hypothetical protein